MISSKIENSELFRKILNGIDVERNLNDGTLTLHYSGTFDYRQRFTPDKLDGLPLEQLKFLFAIRSISMFLNSCGLSDYDICMLEYPKDYVEENNSRRKDVE